MCCTCDTSDLLNCILKAQYTQSTVYTTTEVITHYGIVYDNIIYACLCRHLCGLKFLDNNTHFVVDWLVLIFFSCSKNSLSWFFPRVYESRCDGYSTSYNTIISRTCHQILILFKRKRFVLQFTYTAK